MIGVEILHRVNKSYLLIYEIRKINGDAAKFRFKDRLHRVSLACLIWTLRIFYSYLLFSLLSTWNLHVLPFASSCFKVEGHLLVSGT